MAVRVGGGVPGGLVGYGVRLGSGVQRGGGVPGGLVGNGVRLGSGVQRGGGGVGGGGVGYGVRLGSGVPVIETPFGSLAGCAAAPLLLAPDLSPTPGEAGLEADTDEALTKTTPSARSIVSNMPVTTAANCTRDFPLLAM